MTFDFVCVNSKTTLLQSDEQVISSAKTSERRKEFKWIFAFVQTLENDEKKSEKKYENISANISYITEFIFMCNIICISYERTFETMSINSKETQNNPGI